MNKIYFLPESYQESTGSGGYMRLEPGENKFRIMSPAVHGWEDWLDNKPLRFPHNKKPTKPSDPDRPIKQFFAFVVWNYKASAIQILHITQSSIRKGLANLCADSDWGEPSQYDLKIIKTGTGKETEYVLNPGARNPLTEAQVAAFRAQPIWLEHLFIGANPFQPGSNGELTPLTADLLFKQTDYTEALKTPPRKAAKVEPSPDNLEALLAKLPASYDLPLAEEFIGKCAAKTNQTVAQFVSSISGSSEFERFKRGLDLYLMKRAQ